MPVSVVIGGQFGSEGKGKVAHFLAEERSASFAVRVGGANSGHTVVNRDGRSLIFRQLPTACILNDVGLVIAPGSYLDVELLLREVEIAGISPDRLSIDSSAVIVGESHQSDEVSSGLHARIGSTQTGIGAAVVERVERRGTVKFAKDNPRLAAFNVVDTNALLRRALSEGRRVVIEGTQGFGLSLLHSPYYPFVTSRDTTAAAFISEAGLSPMDVDEVVLVIRAHPIRVSGNSGPLPNEFDWECLTRESGSRDPIVEKTSVTARTRRVARFDAAIVRKAIAVNNPTRIVLNHLDYIDAGIKDSGLLSGKAMAFVRRVENEIGAKIFDIGVGASELVNVTTQLKRVVS